MKLHARNLSLYLALVSLTGCAQEVSVPNSWKSDCIGRYQLSVPNSFETALSFELKKTQSVSNSETKGDFFKNGDSTDRTVFSVDAASLSISHSGDEKDFEAYKRSYFEQRKDESIKKSGIYAPSPVTGSEMKIDSSKAFGWSSANRLSVFLFKQNRVFAAHVSKYKKEALGADSKMNYFLNNFIERTDFDLPSTKGICVPFGFIKDDGSKYRNVGVAMRLIDHPDVEIFFKDTNATTDSADKAPQFKGSRGEVEFFWSYYGPSFGNQLQGTLSHYHDVKLGEYTGKYAFATIARSTDPKEQRYKDGESESTYKARIKQEIADGKRPLDYGFMAAYKGDPTKNDEPDLMLYVIRTASRAVAAGKQPVSEEELKLMALQIAASVKRRPIN
jgi:hypothetical protein